MLVATWRLSPEEYPDVESLVTEDDTPVDNIFSEREQRLLTDSLYDSWTGGGRSYVALANVGMFHSLREPPHVPDVLVSLDVAPPKDLQFKRNRSYFFWEFGKPPDVVIEIVSNDEGGEDTRKLQAYAQLGIAYYVLHDPYQYLSDEVLRVYELQASSYAPRSDAWLPKVGLGLTLWHGVYQQFEDEWLRWCDRDGNILLTGAERAEQAETRIAQLEAQLRALGIAPQA
jgi:Uma2 family endonuclease